MDHHAMLSWAERHLERTEDAIRAYIDGEQPKIIFAQHDLKRSTPEYLETVFTVQPRMPKTEVPDDVICELGDTLHALRIALDYAAVGAVLARNATADESVIAFPICDHPDKFKSARGYRLKDASADLANAIEGLQPYSGPNGLSGVPDHPLWLLDRLEQPHKHRRLLNADFSVHSFRMEIVSGNASDVTFLPVAIPTGPVHAKRELGRVGIALDSGRQPKAHVNAPTTFFVTFEDAGPAHGEPVIQLLKRIRNYVRDDVFPKLDAVP